MTQVDDLNRQLEEASPALFRALAPLGRRAFFPRGIPFQAAEARGTELNGTIGQFTDGAGRAVILPSIEKTLALSDEDRSRAVLYSPVAGRPEVREAWRRWQRRHRPEGSSTLPQLTCGLAHSLSIAADLFTDQDHPVAVLEPYWGNYRQIFTLRTGAPVLTAQAYADRRFRPLAFEEALADLPPGRPAVAILNFPSNPGGYSPTVEERDALCASLVRIAGERPLVVLCDDAYIGLVYDDALPRHSLFWDLIDRHEQLIPVKIDGATKEFGLFGGRVGFLTFGMPQDSAAAEVMENKIMSLVRSTVGSPVALGQILLLQALLAGDIEAQIGEIHRIARERYEAAIPALRELDPALLRPMPFNAGFFALLEVDPKIDVEEARQYLIRERSTGVISVQPHYLRIATCSVAAKDLPEMIRRVGRGVAELAASAVSP